MNNEEKNVNKIMEDNVRKAFPETNVTEVACGYAEDIKNTMDERNKKVIEDAEKHGASIARVAIGEVDNLLFPYKEFMVVSSDASIGLIGDPDPEDAVDMICRIVKSILIRYGTDPEDKADFDMKATMIMMLVAAPFVHSDAMPRKVTKRFVRIMEAINEAIDD